MSKSGRFEVFFDGDCPLCKREIDWLRKRDRDHQVPLSTQVRSQIALLEPLNGKRRFVFASPIKPKQPISENGILQRLRRIGVDKELATPHGFRASGRTILVEQLGYRPDRVEHQLAHKVMDTDGSWVLPDIPTDSIVVNFGQYLERWENEQLPV